MKDEFDEWARFFSGNSSEEERINVQSWIDARIENQEYAAEMRELWESLSARTPSMQSRDANISWNVVLERARTEKGQKKRAKEHPPIKRKRKPPVFFRAGTVLSVVLITVFLFYLPRDSGPGEVITYTSERGERFGIRLSDGSVVSLSVDSKLIVPEKFSSEIREVELEGEAYFEVTTDDQRPFIVHAKSASVHVLGTEFNIRAYESDENVTLLVTEGRVSLKKREHESEEAALVVAGQRGIYTKGQPITVDTYDRFDDELGWREGKLSFIDDTLGDITRELERWYQTEFSFQEEQLKEIKVTATFDLMGNEPLGNVIDVIEEIANVGCERREGSVVISRKKNF